MKLNVTKYKIVVFANRPSGADNLPVCDVDGVVVLSGDVRKCLGYWWKGDLLSSKLIEATSTKLDRLFFNFGSIGVFCGDISPLSSRSVLETYDADTSLWVRELDPHGVPLGEARVISGRAGKTNPEMAKTPISTMRGAFSLHLTRCCSLSTLIMAARFASHHHCIHSRSDP